MKSTFRSGARSATADREFETVELPHHEIGDQEVEHAAGGGELEGVLGIVGARDRVALCLEHLGQNLPDEQLVFDEQHAERRFGDSVSGRMVASNSLRTILQTGLYLW